MFCAPSKLSPIHGVALFLSFLGLTACDMPTQPEGADVNGMTHIGDQLRAGGDEAGAADFYQRSLERNPKDVSARKKLAEILEGRGDNAGAEAQLNAGLAADPSNIDMLHAYGRILIKLGRPADARDDYDKALNINPSDTRALNGRGIALDNLNQHDAAQKSYREALETEPDNLVTINNLGHSYVLAGKYDDAIKLLVPYAKDKNATPVLRQNLAEAYGLNGKDIDAERVASMDLQPSQVKKNLDAYRAQRPKQPVAPKIYADLGSFGTEAMAQARADMIKNTFPDDVVGLVIATTPEIKTSGGTPTFVLRATGFVSADQVTAFCDKLMGSDMGCKTGE